MKIETQLELKKYIQIVFILSYRKPTIIGITLFGIFIVSSTMIQLGSSPFNGISSLLLFFFPLIILILPFSIYRNAKKNFESTPRIQEKINYEFTNEQIKISGESFTTELTWEKTYKVLELKNWILIYQNPRVANVIPKEAFGNNLGEFRELVRSKPFIKQKLKG